jgi:hypothetical protein
MALSSESSLTRLIHEEKLATVLSLVFARERLCRRATAAGQKCVLFFQRHELIGGIHCFALSL